MKPLIYLACALFSLYASGQQPANKTQYVKDFGWTITVPDGFQTITGEDWEKLLHRGVNAPKTTGEEIENRSRLLLILRKDTSNYLEVYYQPYDVEKDGNYDKTLKWDEHILYRGFVAEMPAKKLDSSSTTEFIDGLTFTKFIVLATLPGMKMTILFYSHLLGNRAFWVNIVYTDENNGHLLTEALAHSTFKATKE